jgi:hypothetical protein
VLMTSSCAVRSLSVSILGMGASVTVSILELLDHGVWSFEYGYGDEVTAMSKIQLPMSINAMLQ